MSDNKATLPPRLVNMGIGKRESRTRMECLRLAAESCAFPEQILSWADAFVRFIKSGPDDESGDRWICLRMACQAIPHADDGDSIISLATRFQTYVFGGEAPAPA